MRWQMWGLATDGTHFFFSNGSSTILLLNPEDNMAVVSSLNVTLNGTILFFNWLHMPLLTCISHTHTLHETGSPLDRINELEYSPSLNLLLANRWRDDRIFVIHPRSLSVFLNSDQLTYCVQRLLENVWTSVVSNTTITLTGCFTYACVCVSLSLYVRVCTVCVHLFHQNSGYIVCGDIGKVVNTAV